MNDDEKIDRLERSMAAMHPKAMPANLLAELVDQMARNDRRQLRADRLLLTALSSGLAAALVIASMLLLQSIPDTTSPSISPVIAVGQPPHAGDYLAFFPRNDNIIIK